MSSSEVPANAPEPVERLLIANAAYRRGEPMMPDQAFDALERECLVRYPAYSEVINTIRDELIEDGKGVPHLIPMGSLEKTTAADVWGQGKRVDPWDCIVVEKVDGASLALVYENGELKRAVTRGDGMSGRDVTDRVRSCPDIPSRLPSTGFGSENLTLVRGEVCMSWGAMNEINATTDGDLTHPRNATVGILARPVASDNEADGQHLSFRAFELYRDGSEEGFDRFNRYVRELYELEDAGFTTPYYQIPGTKDTLQEVSDHVIAHPNDIPKDGAVVVINNTTQRRILGMSEDGKMCPLGAIAIKASDEHERVPIIDMEWSPGRFHLTPVAHIPPTELGGATVERVVMKSWGWVRDNDLAIGDMVDVRRSGGVIPHILGVGKHSGGEPIAPPSSCPCCNGLIEVSGSQVSCVTFECPGREARRMEHALKTLGVKGMAYTMLLPLAKRGVALEDLLDRRPRNQMWEDSLMKIVGKAIKTAWKKVTNELERNKPYPPAKLLAALSIKGLGTNTIGALWGDNPPALEELQTYTPEKWGEMVVRARKLGESRGRDIRDDLQSDLIDEVKSLWDDLAAQPLETPSREQEGGLPTPSNLKFPYRSVCLTGKPASKPTIKRDQIKRNLESLGINVTSSVTGATQCLIQGDPDSMTNKSKAARSNGLPIISYERMWDLLGDHAHAAHGGLAR